MAMASLCSVLTTSLLIFVLSLQLHAAARTCEYSDTNSGRMLYMDALADATMTVTGDRGYTYIFTPCRNAAGECPTSGGGVDTSMCKQTDDEGSLCMVVSNYEASVQPTFMNANNGTWIFLYENGNDEGCAHKRMLNLTLVCSEQYDYQPLGAGEYDPSTRPCQYWFKIATKWACAGQYFDPDAGSSALSAGSIFLIILLAGFFAYFCFGWIVCFFMNRKDRGFDVVGNIPHVTFWSKLPALTIAGCCFTKDFCLGLCKKDAAPGNGATASYENIDQ